MGDNEKKVAEKAENNRNLIRQGFDFLKTDYGYQEDFNLIENNIYSQVLYVKNNWKVSITTIAYNRKVSIKLLSPEGDAGFLDYYFGHLEKKYDATPMLIDSLVEDITYKSYILKTFGQLIHEANPVRLREILGEIISQHTTWIKENIIRNHE
jgi:hypothetical protein